MHAAIASHLTDLAGLCRRYGVARLEVFGSAARGSDFDPQRSDADFLVMFTKDAALSPLSQYIGFAEALEDLLGRKVDLVDRESVRNPFVSAAIDRDREVVYAA